ncbi:MAG: hypothetical protein GWN61_01640, partial [candidate division Zixibacteria bacterium]|nr:hypothetical protein [Phycisphaerae bacterium]NIR62688.1 hypothetical protein [candidate division Zixibacteria bacterium]NIW43636.1 hypothetical protein [Gammaproteobacteria bacterium]NIP55218.1 hypothetical protein [Phycisphaerae bacterium]NIS51116.1 hypothetical protein [Phycisphaerae bacterium]
MPCGVPCYRAVSHTYTRIIIIYPASLAVGSVSTKDTICYCHRRVTVVVHTGTCTICHSDYIARENAVSKIQRRVFTAYTAATIIRIVTGKNAICHISRTIKAIHTTTHGTIDNSYATGSASGDNYIGGLVGGNKSGIIFNCYSTGNVIGANDVGGLVGYNSRSTVSKCYSTGNVSGT